MTVANTAQFAWQNAERRCFDYLLKGLASVEAVYEDGITRQLNPPSELGYPATRGYLAKFPRAIPDAKTARVWKFSIGGDSEVLQIQATGRPCRGWAKNATFECVCIKRTDLLQVAGLLRNIVPVDADNTNPMEQWDIFGVQRLTLMPGDSLEPAVMTVEHDNDKGGEVECWRLVQPMLVVFTNTEKYVDE